MTHCAVCLPPIGGFVFFPGLSAADTTRMPVAASKKLGGPTDLLHAISFG
jgi:hypothetical protein